MPAKLNFFKTPASKRLVSSRSVSTSTGISGCFQPGQAKVGPGPTPLILPVLRIRDVYPGSRILIVYPSRIPGSRIQKPQQKRGVKKICCHAFFCSHQFHKIERYFMFEMLKKKIWPSFQRIKIFGGQCHSF
jgi:hypothetical protein